MAFVKGLFKSKKSTDPPEFEVFYCCNECLAVLKSGVKRYTCVDCVRSYDLCQKCYGSGKAVDHTSTMGSNHNFVVETKSRVVISSLLHKTESLEELILSMFRFYAARPAVGQYNRDSNTYVYLTFDKLFEAVSQFGSGLKKILQNKNCRQSMISMCSIARLEWYITDLACLLLNIPTVPIGSNSTKEQMKFILNQAEIAIVVCSMDTLREMAKILPECPSIQAVILMDIAHNCTEALKSCEDDVQVPDSVDLIRFSEVINLGKKYPVNLSKMKHKPTDIYTVAFTSGSTGDPKGCVFSRKTWKSRIDKGGSSLVGRLSIWLSFHPPSHNLERSSFFVTLLNGGKIGIYRGSMEKLFDDFALVRPTIVASTPRLWNMLYNQYMQELHEAYVQYRETEDAIEASTDDLTAEHFDVEQVPFELRREIMSKFKDKLGGREYHITTGGAPTGKNVKQFIIECFEGMVNEGYGSTEVGGIVSDGLVLPRRDVKLLSVPEMGYFTTDTPPRGEICVKTPDMIDGYFKRPDITAEKFVDGYFHTGDIGIMDENGTVKLIDRKKNIFKLSQGEFVSPERLEILYVGGSCYINQIYVYGNSLQANIVAVIVPETKEMLKIGKRLFSEIRDISELCHSQEVVEVFLEELQAIAKEKSLPGWEVPVGILLEPEPFTVENGLLTSTFKKSRPKLEQKYKHFLENLYTTRSSNSDRPLEIIIFKWMQEKIRSSDHEVSSKHTLDSTKSFSQLGGDSLSATHLSSLLREHLSLELPVETILKTPLDELLANTSSNERPSLVPIDWNKEASIECLELLESDQPRPSLSDVPEMSTSVLLTGCTGFLGRFLLWELLRDSETKKVFCLVKKKNELSARERVTKLLDQIRQEFQCADVEGLEKLIVVEGDLSKPKLSLSNEDYTTLCEEVDTIIHNGASVNHVLSYLDLKDCNVSSTIELLRIAMTSKSKFFHYVSTIGVFSSWQSHATESVVPSKERLNGLSGYSQSKWVSESLVISAISKGLIMGNISRPGLIGPHGETGHANLQDWVYWLVKGLVLMGTVPTGQGCEGKEIHWVPVEQVARAVAFISLNHKGWVADQESNIWHLVNSHTPVKFSDLTDALMSTHPMKTTNYKDFRQALRSQSRVSGDQVLVSLDLLLPVDGGWPHSPVYYTEIQKADKLQKAGIILEQLSEQYVLRYLQYILDHKKN